MHCPAPTSRLLFVGLLTALLWQGAATRTDACQYCRMAATDPEAARMAAMMHSGGFPLDATINQFQGVAPAAILTAPPASDRVVTSAADLPMPVRPVVPPPAPAKMAAPVAAAKPPPTPVRWADVGLLGLLASGSLFYWRTRRVSAPVADGV